MAKVKFEKPDDWGNLSRKERRAARREWRQDPATVAEKEEARSERRAKRRAFLSKFVLSPVLDKVKPAVAAAVEDGLEGGDAIDDAVEYLMEKADDLADFNFIKVPLVGAALEGITDVLLDIAEAELTDLAEEAYREVLADLEG